MIQGILTLLMMTGFLGICVWAYSRSNRERFAEAARLPLEDDQSEGSS